MSDAPVSEKAREAVSNYMAAASAMMGEYSPVSLAFLDEACDSLPIVQAFARFEADVRREVVEQCAKVAGGHFRGHGNAYRTQRAHNYEHAGKVIARKLRAILNGDAA